VSWRRVRQQSHWNVEAEEQFERASRRTHAEVANLIAEYAALKMANRLTKDGEVIDRKKANRQESELNTAIKKALADLGETEMFVEGSGGVRLRETDSISYRLDALSPEQLAELLPVLAVKRTDVTEEIEGSHARHYKPEWAWLRDYEVRGRGATQLLFEEPK
jgi:hypothetical protein